MKIAVTLSGARTAKGKGGGDDDGERGERVPLQRVALVHLHAEIDARPVSLEAIIRARMLLDHERLELEARLGGVAGDVHVLAHGTGCGTRFQRARQPLERDAIDALDTC